jgi:hypothetical protein
MKHIVAIVLFCSGCGVFAPSLREGTLPTWQEDADHVVTSSATLRMVMQVRGQDVVLPEGWEVLVEADDTYLLATTDDQQIIEIHADVGTTCDDVTEAIAREHVVGRAPQYGSSGCMAEFVATDVRDAPARAGDDMSFQIVATERVTLWEQDGILVRVISSSDSPNHQTAVMLASRLAAILAVR